jgi:hypothetical protein
MDVANTRAMMQGLINPAHGFFSDAHTRHLSDINRTVDEWTVRFITGTADLNRDWNAYYADLRSAGYYELQRSTANFLDRQ